MVSEKKEKKKERVLNNRKLESPELMRPSARSKILSPRPILVLHFLIVRHKAIPKIIISREIFDTVSWVQRKLTASRFVVW